MRKLFSCLIALLCAAGMTIPAMADVLPYPRAVFSGGLLLLVLGVILVAVAIIIAVIRRNKK